MHPNMLMQLNKTYIRLGRRLSARNWLGLFHLLLHALDRLECVEYLHKLGNKPFSLYLLMPLNPYTHTPSVTTQCLKQIQIS